MKWRFFIRRSHPFAISGDGSSAALGAVILGWPRSYPRTSPLSDLGNLYYSKRRSCRQFGRVRFHCLIGLVPSLSPHTRVAAARAVAVNLRALIFVCGRGIERENHRYCGLWQYWSPNSTLSRRFRNARAAMHRSTDHRDHGFQFPGIGDPEGTLPDRYYTPDQLHSMLNESDIVVIAVPLTQKTRGCSTARPSRQ